MGTIGIRHTVESITPEQLTHLYDVMQQQRDRLRAVRLVSEQLDRTADDITPPTFGVRELTAAEAADLRDAKTIRRCTVAVYGALAGHGHRDPHIPEPRHDRHSRAAGWGTPGVPFSGLQEQQ